MTFVFFAHGNLLDFHCKTYFRHLQNLKDFTRQKNFLSPRVEKSLYGCVCFPKKGALAMQAYILFLGPPFVGKSTQTNLVREKYGAQLLSTGDILREPASQNILTNVADEKSGRQLTVAELNARGLYTDAETVIGLVRKKIQIFGGASIVSDSYPRSVAQLGDFREKLGLDFSAVFYLRASTEENYWKIFERRREARRYCTSCSDFFDPITKPSANGNCPKDGTEIVRRKDDEPEVARKRFDSYMKNAAPLVEALKSHRNFREIIIDDNGIELSPDEIFARVSLAVDKIPRAYELPVATRVPA